MRNLKLQVVQLAIDLIKNRPENARTHSAKQLANLATGIRTFGFVVPVLVDENHVLIAGHARVKAARAEGLSHVPAICISHLSPEQVRALTLADNRMSEMGGFDKVLLAKEFAALVDLLPMPELLATGYQLEEIELFRDAAGSRERPIDEPRLPTVDRAKPSVSQVGDLWLIGEHKLLCADALHHQTYASLLGSEKADLVIVDPPYNRKINGELFGSQSIQHSEFVQASGELSRWEFQHFLQTMCRNLATFSRSGSLHYIFMDWRSIGDLLTAGEAHYDALLNVIVWMKSNGGGMGSLYRSQHELIALFKHGRRSHKNNVELGANGRNRTNVWQYPGANGAGQRTDLKLHPTVKNLDMITDAIRDASDRGDVILDAFGGSGTTLLAAHRCGRRARIVELDPYYCDLIISRAAGVGLQTVLASTGQIYADISASREGNSGTAHMLSTEGLS